MFQKLSNSWELVKESLRVLQADKELMVFPIISSIGVLIVTLTFLFPCCWPVFLTASPKRGRRWSDSSFCSSFYLVQYTVIFFANTALVGRRHDPPARRRSHRQRRAENCLQPLRRHPGLCPDRRHRGHDPARDFPARWGHRPDRFRPVRPGLEHRHLPGGAGAGLENVGPIDAVKRSVALAQAHLGRANRRQPGHRARSLA